MYHGFVERIQDRHSEAEPLAKSPLVTCHMRVVVPPTPSKAERTKGSRASSRPLRMAAVKSDGKITEEPVLSGGLK